MVGIHRSATWVVTGRTGSKTERKKRWAGEKWWWWIRAVGIPSQRHCWYFFTVFSLTLAQIPSLASSSLLFLPKQRRTAASAYDDEEDCKRVVDGHRVNGKLRNRKHICRSCWDALMASGVHLLQWICPWGTTNHKYKIEERLTFFSLWRETQRYWVVHRFAQEG